MKDNRAGISILAMLTAVCAMLDWWFNSGHLFLLIGIIAMLLALGLVIIVHRRKK